MECQKKDQFQEQSLSDDSVLSLFTWSWRGSGVGRIWVGGLGRGVSGSLNRSHKQKGGAVGGSDLRGWCTIQYNTIQYNTTWLSVCREICFLARHLHKKHSIQLTIKHQQLNKTRSSMALHLVRTRSTYKDKDTLILYIHSFYYALSLYLSLSLSHTHTHTHTHAHARTHARTRARREKGRGLSL